MSKSKRETLAEQFQKAIRDSGLSINAIANGAGIPQPVLSRFVNDQRDLTLRTADKLAEFFSMRLTAPKRPKV